MNVVYDPGTEQIINQCLKDEYDEYVAIAKGKYYYERVENNPDAEAFYKTYRSKTADDLQSFINSLPSIKIFFPVWALKTLTNGAYDPFSLFEFCVCCEVLVILKRFLPSRLRKKIKAIASIERREVTFSTT